MGQIIFFSICAILFILACIIGVIALYLSLRGWALEEFDIELPPKAKPDESYWETLEANIVPNYVCKKCNYESDSKYWHCPCCGRFMENHRD